MALLKLVPPPVLSFTLLLIPTPSTSSTALVSEGWFLFIISDY